MTHSCVVVLIVLLRVDVLHIHVLLVVVVGLLVGYVPLSFLWRLLWWLLVWALSSIRWLLWLLLLLCVAGLPISLVAGELAVISCKLKVRFVIVLYL